MREEDLAKDLKLHPKQLRRVLQMLMEEKLVIREHRKEVILLILVLLFSSSSLYPSDGFVCCK